MDSSWPLKLKAGLCSVQNSSSRMSRGQVSSELLLYATGRMATSMAFGSEIWSLGVGGVHHHSLASLPEAIWKDLHSCESLHFA